MLVTKISIHSYPILSIVSEVNGSIESHSVVYVCCDSSTSKCGVVDKVTGSIEAKYGIVSGNCTTTTC